MNITLPIPVSANRYWRHGNGHNYKSEAAIAYCEQVGWLCREAQLEPTVNQVEITMHVHLKDKRRDVDNCTKVLFDALQGHVYQNDRQIVAYHVYRHEVKSNPRVELTVDERKPAFTYSVSVSHIRELVVDVMPCECAGRVQKALAGIKGIDHIVKYTDWLAVVPKARVKVSKLQERIEAELASAALEG